MQRDRTARSAVLGFHVRRPAPRQATSRTSSALRRRIVLGLLVVLALALITISFREAQDGPLHRAQATAANVLQPLQIAVERVARPFRDAYGWTAGLLDARRDAERLRGENAQLRLQVIQNESALQQNVELKRLLDYVEGPLFPGDYTSIATTVTSRPSSAFEQVIVLPVGTKRGVEQYAPVVTDEGLVGQVTEVTADSSRVTLLTDESSAVSAVDLVTKAEGIVEHGPVGDSLVMSRVSKKDPINVGDEIVTSGWRSGSLASLYPRGIRIGRVTSVGTLNTDLYQQVQVESDVDFSSLDSVLVLVKKPGAGE
ncbi:MAG TPA: rod shape-determining protein MreC [Gaiellaceae bacterium]|nr:rod shape-determining protein MreC [Gaiellaceae bacterium]